jgi:predicted HD phosphohydrolase
VSRSVDDLLALLGEGAGVADDDRVDQLQHALQCAAVLRAGGADDELVAAGLVHDVGHLLPGGFHTDDHETVGAAAVRPLLGDRVARLVELHVPAKRWLVSVGTHDLSPGSALSLEVQGGRMSDEERAAFEADPLHADAVRLRRADEAAKDGSKPAAAAELRAWRPLLTRVAEFA